MSSSAISVYLPRIKWVLSISLLVFETVQLCRFEHSLALSFFGIGMKIDLFQSCGHCWVFQICWHTECSTFTASCFRIWSSSPGIPSLPPALLIVMLPEAHFTSIPECLPLGRWSYHHGYLDHKDFFCTVLLYILATSSWYHLQLGPYCFCPLLCLSLMKCSLGISNFLEEISSFSHSIFFLYFLHWSLRKAFLSLCSILWYSAFKWVYLSFSPLPFASLLFSAIC